MATKSAELWGLFVVTLLLGGLGIRARQERARRRSQRHGPHWEPSKSRRVRARLSGRARAAVS